jgi:hypothetical protein
MLVTIQLDDSQVEDARAVLEAWKEAGHGSKELEEHHVLKNAVNLGLATLRGVWLREGTTKTAQRWREAQDAEKEGRARIDYRGSGTEAREGAVEAPLAQNERPGV